MKGFSFLAFVFLTILCWGVYGPVLHHGQFGMGNGSELSLFRPIMCVGIAYFLIAVVFPLFVLFTRGEKGIWSISGFIWSFTAGAIGAIGAVGVALSFKYGGEAVYVMPLIFGFAPVVNTIVTMLMGRTTREASIPFYIGVLIVAVGGAGVLVFKPAPAKPVDTHTAPPVVTQVSWQSDMQEEQESSPATETAGEKTEEKTEVQTAPQSGEQPATSEKIAPPKSERNIVMIVICVAMTALCWGAYGPILHKGQMKMAGSRLRPFLCVGIAYFALGVILPWLYLNSVHEPGGWHFAGTSWSLAAGAAGAIGALGIIYAFNFGGRPIFVMPLVFGGAPVINTFSQTLEKGLGEVPQAFYLSLALVILGAVTVLVCAPRGHATPVAPKPANPYQ